MGTTAVWAKNGTPGGFVKILEYDFCTNSGILGPKRMEGDRQIPEGFYFIDRFNSKSKFYLSLGLNYPNASDLVLSDQEKPGSDIFIHGGCSSVGCIAITDEKIKQLYVLASEAKKYGQKEIPVHIFPFRMTDEALAENAEKHPQLLPFWKDLQKGYAVFKKTGKLPSFSVLGNGRYVFKD